MKNIKQTFLVTLIIFCFGITYSQTADSLSVYPNPFDSLANIHFDIVESDIITLKVFNATGLTVKTFFQSTILPSGSYNLNLLGDGLVAGIYYIKLDIGSTKSITKTVTKVGSTTGIIEDETTDQLLIYPNPAKDLITIPLPGVKTIMITSLNGKTLKSLETVQQIISLSEITAGQYVITVLINDNEIITTQRIIKID